MPLTLTFGPGTLVDFRVTTEESNGIRPLRPGVRHNGFAVAALPDPIETGGGKDALFPKGHGGLIMATVGLKLKHGPGSFKTLLARIVSANLSQPSPSRFR